MNPYPYNTTPYGTTQQPYMTGYPPQQQQGCYMGLPEQQIPQMTQQMPYQPQPQMPYGEFGQTIPPYSTASSTPSNFFDSDNTEALSTSEEETLKREFSMMADSSGHIGEEQVRGLLSKFGLGNMFGSSSSSTTSVSQTSGLMGGLNSMMGGSGDVINKLIYAFTGGSKVIGFVELVLLFLFIKRMRKSFTSLPSNKIKPTQVSSALNTVLPSQYQQYSTTAVQSSYPSTGYGTTSYGTTGYGTTGYGTTGTTGYGTTGYGTTGYGTTGTTGTFTAPYPSTANTNYQYFPSRSVDTSGQSSDVAFDSMDFNSYLNMGADAMLLGLKK